MTNIAVLCGNVNYDRLQKLDCCKADLEAIKELLNATKKYDLIETIEDVDSSTLKERLRNRLDHPDGMDDLFFYFTGHGASFDNEFFFCSTDFDPSRPFETGLSTTDLHTLLRLSNANVVVKVVDACNSGTLLIKSDIGLTPQNKQGFKSLIQISSCLDNQTALTGNPLSLFTDKFYNAALRKHEGIIYYTDLIAALRDEFLNNDRQTPFFVF